MPKAKQPKKVLASERLAQLQNFVDQIKTGEAIPFEEKTKRAEENLKKAGLIKPILYHSFEEKAALEEELFSKIPIEKRKRKWEALVKIFYDAGVKTRKAEQEK